MKVLEQTQISPAPGSRSPASLPLTIFDLMFMVLDPVQRVFFYELPCSTSDFMLQRLPQLKLSLSLALREFRPLAGSLNLNSDGGKPEFQISDSDEVSLMVTESADDFYDLSGSHARDCARFHPLVPQLHEKQLLALQITLFPEAGAALGITVSHGVADGATTSHFLKTWAAACRLSTGEGEIPMDAPPSYDRSVIQDASSLERALRELIGRMGEGGQVKKLDIHDRKDIVRRTFTFSREQIKKMGEEFASKTGKAGSSTFILASGFIWACLVKAKGGSGGKKEFFGFVFEVRARLEPPLSTTYFGNCVGYSGAEAEWRELESEEGMLSAWTAIWNAVQIVREGNPLRVAEDWLRGFSPSVYAGMLTVAGSPRLGMYQVNFGWGRPRKVEVISIERTSAMSMAEGGEDGRGVEIGIALPRDLMEVFDDTVADHLSAICGR